MNSHTIRTACIAIGIIASCVIWLPDLYDKFLIARFVAVAAGLAILFLFALIGKKRWRIPNTPVFYIYLLFTLFCGCSILWATNTAEAIFAFSTQLLTPLIIIVIFSLLSTNRHVTQNALWVSAGSAQPSFWRCTCFLLSFNCFTWKVSALSNSIASVASTGTRTCWQPCCLCFPPSCSRLSPSLRTNC